MTLPELKKVIADIYPGQTQFYVIEFKFVARPSIAVFTAVNSWLRNNHLNYQELS